MELFPYATLTVCDKWCSKLAFFLALDCRYLGMVVWARPLMARLFYIFLVINVKQLKFSIREHQICSH